MTQVGDKQILTTQTLLLGDDEVGRFDVPIETAKLSVAVRFLSAEVSEPTLEWRFADGLLSIDAAGWNNPQGGRW